MRAVLEFMDTVIIPMATKGGNALVEKALADFMEVVKAACPDLFFQSSAGHPDTFDCEQIQNSYQLLEDMLKNAAPDIRSKIDGIRRVAQVTLLLLCVRFKEDNSAPSGDLITVLIERLSGRPPTIFAQIADWFVQSLYHLYPSPRSADFKADVIPF